VCVAGVGKCALSHTRPPGRRRFTTDTAIPFSDNLPVAAGNRARSPREIANVEDVADSAAAAAAAARTSFGSGTGGGGNSGGGGAAPAAAGGSLRLPAQRLEPSLIDTYDDLGATAESPPGSDAPSSPAWRESSHSLPSRSASGTAGELRTRSGRRGAHRGPSGLRAASLGQESMAESVLAAAMTTATTTTGTCSSANASPRKRSNCSTPTGEDGGAAAVAGASAAGRRSTGSAGPAATTDGDSAPDNIRASFERGGASAFGAPAMSTSDVGEALLSWRQKALGSFSMDGASDTGNLRSASFDSRRNMTLQQLQKAIKDIMLTDGEMYAKLEAGLQGIGSLARETKQLRMNRDVTGATCINQYVVVKTLGRGSFGKVKLCLNTVDGQLYAIKMMNRSFLLRMLQRPKAALRKSARRSSASQDAEAHAAAAAPSAGPSPTAGAAAPPAAAARPPSAAPAGAGAGGLRGLESMDEVSKEIAILKKLDHPNVVKLYEVIDPPGSQYMMLVMEYLEKGPVLQTNGQAGFKRLPEEVRAL
jgi:hypothetical protein